MDDKELAELIRDWLGWRKLLGDHDSWRDNKEAWGKLRQLSSPLAVEAERAGKINSGLVSLLAKLHVTPVPGTFDFFEMVEPLNRATQEVYALRVAKAAALPARQDSKTEVDAPDASAAADRVVAVLAKLAHQREFHKTQEQVAQMASCSARTLRRGRGKKAWRSYTDAGCRSLPISSENE